MIIDKFIPIRDDIPILNKYEIIKSGNYNDDFHVVIYYLNENKCKIITRRLDEETGWGMNLLVKIYDKDNNKNITISIGSSESNCKIFDIYTFIELYPIVYSEQKIPKRIIQTSVNNNCKNIYNYNAFMTFIELNPEYEYYFFDNNDVKKFIRDNFDEEVLEAYDTLVPGAYKADLFRYCYLYIHGGCYFDNKQILRQPIRNLIESNDIDIYCKDTVDYFMFNAVMISDKNNKILFDIIYKIVNNVKNNFYGDNPLEPTGPLLLNKYSHNRTIKLQHIVDGNYYTESKILIKANNELFINTHYKGYYDNNNRDSNNTYGKLHGRKEIYYENKIVIDKYKIYIYPHNTNNKFTIYFEKNNKLIIKRIDENEGWEQNLIIKIINNIDLSETTIFVGSSFENKKIITHQLF
jgi:mannosyltransferase OCH1-like enzyme